VALDEGLIVPVIRDCQAKSLTRIAGEIREKAARARQGRLTPDEYSGGTFTVSNLGMYGITNFTAVINPPQAAILSVGALQPTPVVRDRDVVVRHIMGVTLACDHRILYGADAAEFLGRIRALLEEPLKLAL
jgi:pyruvate dehydrogenase E2 component (dihydrolipoamide acetyltransferase)